MAVIDYGCVVIKNGIVQNTYDFFMDMEKSVGWIDKDLKDITDTKQYEGVMNGNYMGYIGDKDLTICFYKCYERVHLGFINLENINIPSIDEMLYMSNNKINDYHLSWDYEWINDYYYSESWISKKFKIEVPNYGIVDVNVKYIAPSVKMLWMTYKGDHYRVIYGYGIDSNWKTWNKIKVKYLGKKLSKKIDSIYRAYIKDYGYKALIDTEFNWLIGFNSTDWDYDCMIKTLKKEYDLTLDDLSEYDKLLESDVTPSNLDEIADSLNKYFEEDTNRFKTIYLSEFSKLVSIENPYKTISYPENVEVEICYYLYG